MLAIICPFNTIIFMFSLEILSVAHFCRKNDFKLFVLSNYSSSFWYSNTIRIVFPERVITRYSIRTDFIFEYIFGTRFVQKFGIRSNSDLSDGLNGFLYISMIKSDTGVCQQILDIRLYV